MRSLICALVLAAAAAHAPAQTPEQSPPPGRPNAASPDSPAPACVLRDTFGNLPRADEEAILDKFAAALNSEPQTTLHVIAYGGRRGPRGEVRARRARVRRYLVSRRGIPDGRIVTVEGGYREEATAEFWFTSPGAAPPVPTPNIDPGDVEFTDRVPRRQRGKQASARRPSRSE